MRNSKYLLAIVWLSVLIGASASNSFQRVSASTEREACVTGLVQIQGNPDATVIESLNSISNAVECLSLSESNTTERKACVTEMIRIQVNPDAGVVEMTDTILNAVICLART